MSIVGAAFERSRWEYAAYATALRTDSGISLPPAQIARLMDAGLAYGHIEQERDGLQCARSHAFAAFREVALGERATWRVSRNDPFSIAKFYGEFRTGGTRQFPS
ncbi:MAG TPA: hypothetical protein VNE82_17860 [Candidatus Binataceae bacterium]|nr:hypothetical protein [Candidatus Binataceae bacterium]